MIVSEKNISDALARKKVRFERLTCFNPMVGSCFEWAGAKTKRGYGQFRDGKMRLSHRVAYEIYVGPIPPGMDVLHICDNPACVRTAHLFVGTHQNNMDDMVSKGRRRGPSGNNHHSAKLTEEEVIQARNSGISTMDFARKHGVHRTTALRALSGQRWKQI